MFLNQSEVIVATSGCALLVALHLGYSILSERKSSRTCHSTQHGEEAVSTDCAYGHAPSLSSRLALAGSKPWIALVGFAGFIATWLLLPEVPHHDAPVEATDTPPAVKPPSETVPTKPQDSLQENHRFEEPIRTENLVSVPPQLAAVVAELDLWAARDPARTRVSTVIRNDLLAGHPPRNSPDVAVSDVSEAIFHTFRMGTGNESSRYSIDNSSQLVLDGTYGATSQSSEVHIEIGIHRPIESPDAKVYWCEAGWGGETTELQYTKSAEPWFGTWTYAKENESVDPPNNVLSKSSNGNAVSILRIPLKPTTSNSRFRVIIKWDSTAERQMDAEGNLQLMAWLALNEDFGQTAPLANYNATIISNLPLDQDSVAVFGEKIDVSPLDVGHGLQITARPLGPSPGVVVYRVENQ